MIEQIKGWWMPQGEQHLRDHPWEGDQGYQYQQRRQSLEGLPRGGRALDIGAHVGLWSRDLCDHFDHVIAYEPCAEHRQCLELNCQEPNLEIRPEAVGERRGRTGLKIFRGNSGHTQRCEGDDLDMICLDEELGLEDIRFIKIDVEGWEYEVITGAERLIRTQRPRICLEQKPHERQPGSLKYRSRDLLESWGYRRLQHHGDDWVLEWPR